MHFKFWGQSLNKGTWLTAAAKDTNYFHQTVVITIKSCLSISSSAPPHQSPAQHAFQRWCYISKPPRGHESYLFPSSAGKGRGDPSGSVSTSSCFQPYFNVIETWRHWNKSVKVPFQDFYKRLHKDVLCVHENLWRLKINARCLLQSLSTLFMYLLARLIA